MSAVEAQHGENVFPQATSLAVPRSAGHQLPRGHRVAARPILGGLHHEYRLELVAA
jgi:hypothetical protein